MSLDSSQKILLAFLAVVLLAGVLYQLGVINRLAAWAARVMQAAVTGGFGVWRRFLYGIPWPALLAVIVGVHALLWVGGLERSFLLPLILGAGLLFVGLASTLAFMYL